MSFGTDKVEQEIFWHRLKLFGNGTSFDKVKAMPSSPLESVNLVSQGKEKKLSVLETRLPKGEQDQNQVDHHF